MLVEVVVLSQLPLARPEIARGLDALRKRLSLGATALHATQTELNPDTIAQAISLSPKARILILVGADRAIDCKLNIATPNLAVYAISVGGRLPRGGCFASIGATIEAPLDADAVTRAFVEIADVVGKTAR